MHNSTHNGLRAYTIIIGCGLLPLIVCKFRFFVSLQSASGHFRFLVPRSGTTCLSTSHLRRHSRFADNDSRPVFPFLPRRSHLTRVLLSPFITTVWTPVVLAIINIILATLKKFLMMMMMIPKFTTSHCYNVVYLQHGDRGNYYRQNGVAAHPTYKLRYRTCAFAVPCNFQFFEVAALHHISYECPQNHEHQTAERQQGLQRTIHGVRTPQYQRFPRSRSKFTSGISFLQEC